MEDVGRAVFSSYDIAVVFYVHRERVDFVNMICSG